MGQIDRTGSVVFGDAYLCVWEEGLGGTWAEREAWETAFKRQVFTRIIQTLNRIGWKCVIPEEKIERYGRKFAERRRYCVKGDLKADLDISGRCIKLDMFQNLNAPDRPDHEGRYQSNKEMHMPYLLLLEMKRTRNRIMNYLCNVFSGYEFKSDGFSGKPNKCGPGYMTAMEWLNNYYKTSCHFKGDPTTYKISDYNRKSANETPLEHGQRVWFFDRKGRINTGIAYYNINNMWWVLSGKYGRTNLSAFDLFTDLPDDFRRKRNGSLRERRLKELMSKSVDVLDFERAAVLRDLLITNAVTP